MISMRTATVFALAFASLLLAGAFLPLTEVAKAQDNTPLELNPMSLFFVEGMEMSPLVPESTDEFQAVTIPNGFIKDGFRGFNLLPVGHTYWKAVGTWYTQPLKQKINLGGRAEVSIFASKEESDGTNPSCEFRFEILRGEQLLLDIYVDSTRINEGQDIKITAASSFPPGNDTTIEPGISLALRVTARCNGGGAVLKFGSKTYPSGFTFGSNALQIHNVQIQKHHVMMEYKDAFMVPWTKLYAQLSLNRAIIPNDEMSSIMNPINMTRELHWERYNRVGEYEVFVSIGYSPEQNISTQTYQKITEVKENWFKLDNMGNLVKNNMAIVVIIILIFAALIMYARHKGRVWDRRIKHLPSEIKGKNRGAQKDAWKEIDKKRRQKWKEDRKKRVIEDDEIDEELEDEEFRLFKKKVKRTSTSMTPEELLDEDDLDSMEI